MISGQENPDLAQIKKWLADISPDDFSDRYLGRLILLPDMDDDSMAFVEKNFSSGKWDVYVNLRSLAEGKKEMIFTLIHEFAHILTLNEKQIDEEASPSSCETFWIEEGCARAGGYLAGFYDRFWREEGEDFSPEPSPDETLARYEERPESYVTEYAAANPVEDLAESFAAFIFRQIIDSPATEAEQKVSFFADYADLRQIRDSIRKNLRGFAFRRLPTSD